MLSSPGKAWQRRTGCHSRGLLPHERCCPRGSMGRSPSLTMEIPVFQFGYALLSVIKHRVPIEHPASKSPSNARMVYRFFRTGDAASDQRNEGEVCRRRRRRSAIGHARATDSTAEIRQIKTSRCEIQTGHPGVKPGRPPAAFECVQQHPRSPARPALLSPRILPRAYSDTTEYFWRNPVCTGHRGDRSSALTGPTGGWVCCGTVVDLLRVCRWSRQNTRAPALCPEG
jgi:hypothetical protein